MNKKMKKLVFIATMAVSLMACTNGTVNEYKAQAEQLAEQLSESYQKQDTAAVLTLNDSILDKEAKVLATGDTAAIAAFRNTLKEARTQAMEIIAAVELSKGLPKDTIVSGVSADVLNGSVSIEAVTRSIDVALSNEQKQRDH